MCASERERGFQSEFGKGGNVCVCARARARVCVCEEGGEKRV